MYKEFDVVKLRDDREKDGLKKGTVGAIVMVHDADDGVYEVEFVDADGNTLALLTLKDSDLLPA